MLKIPSILRRAHDGLSHQGRVVRMNPLEDELDGGCRRAVALEDAKRFVGPGDLAGGAPPTEAPRMTQPLRFRQARLAALQVPFRESPVHPPRQERHPEDDEADSATSRRAKRGAPASV